MKKYFKYNTIVGDLYIGEEDNHITNITTIKNFEGELEEVEIIKKAYEQLQEYFNGERKSFDLPLNPKGTDFQKSVWNALLQIPYGEVWSYKDVAKYIGNEKACRAVGNANNKNPIVIIIPCHRVIGTNGKLVGYGGGLPMKEKLLKLEGIKYDN